MQDDIRITYKKYYGMAQNNPEIAMQFLKNAYEDKLKEIKKTIGDKVYTEFIDSIKIKEG